MPPDRLLATYRLQLGPELTFDRVRELVPYFRELGITHLYLSPSLQARSGSTHGYDVVDPGSISRELGGEDAFRAMAGAGLGVILDIVPNHMGTGDENRWWSDDEQRYRVFDVDPETERYRRFFDIDDLAGVRVEDPEVFEETHALVLRLLDEGVIDGLRIDHPDGLADPAGYLRRLRERGAEHVWVEKILEPGEPLRDWPVEGTVGYEFLGEAQSLMVDPRGRAVLDELHAELTGESRPFHEVAEEAKLEQASGTFSFEVERLARCGPPGLDEAALARALASFPVYRSYVEPWSGRVEEEDRRVIAAAGLPDELARVLLLEERGYDEFVARFQQTSPPVMAKGVEDTAFYRWIRLLALNEVGSDPARFGLSVDDFHRLQAERAERFPRGLLVLQTHDTKRSADVRARIGALAGMAHEWRDAVSRWFELCDHLRGSDGPDGQEAYLVFQTLVGTWPIEIERLEAYLEKALREAKRTSNWIEPNTAREAAVQRFARRALEHGPFLSDFVPFADRVAAAGRRSALAQLLLMLCSPGVPTIYQGDELEALSLVDPDNRRPVDWSRRVHVLEHVRSGAAPTVVTGKLWLIRTALALRAERPAAFDGGGYEPVDTGPGTVGFVRGGEVLCAVPTRRSCLPEPPPQCDEWLDALDGHGRSRGLLLRVRP